ncbi:MAG: methyltransferase domain-containing protein [Chlorobiaceae bacterium]
MKKLFQLILILFIYFSLSYNRSYCTPIQLNINTKHSLLRIGVDPSIRTDKGKQLANSFFDSLDANDINLLKISSRNYLNIQVIEKQTLDYSALKWLCDRVIEEKTKGKPDIHDTLSLDYYKYFVSNNYKFLKEYLLGHYGIKNYKPVEEADIVKNRQSFLEDLILFNDPSRVNWDSADKIINLINVIKGDKIVDIGAGFGFYSNKLAEKVGNTGIVYSVDTNNLYTGYVNNYTKAYNIPNIIPIHSKENNISVNDKVDTVFMCSLYHIIYGWAQEGNRKAFLNSIKQVLKPGGRFYIIDNSFFNGNELNNCYIYKELIISQLQMYGFKYIKHYDISSKRYLLEFVYLPGSLNSLSVKNNNTSESDKNISISIEDGRSIIHIGSLDSYDTTPKGILGARMVLNVLTKKNKKDAANTVLYYDNLIPNENFGGEYTALQWFCKYEAATISEQKSILKDPLIKSYYEYLSNDNYKILKNYILYKYKLIDRSKVSIKNDINSGDDDTKEIGRTKRAFIEDFILFNNPQRENWEKTSDILSHLPIKPGNKIVDLGSGSGYYSYKFSRIVGDSGRVYAVDTKKAHLDFINSFTKKYFINNITTVKAGDDQGYYIPEKADFIFLCSLYHIVYGVFSHNEREIFIKAILNSLHNNGKLIIVDNCPVLDSTLPYHGPYITKELIISQLAHYGLELSEYYQTIPQRYILIFKRKLD